MEKIQHRALGEHRREHKTENSRELPNFGIGSEEAHSGAPPAVYTAYK
jgi:hypothetical protein